MPPGGGAIVTQGRATVLWHPQGVRAATAAAAEWHRVSRCSGGEPVEGLDPADCGRVTLQHLEFIVFKKSSTWWSADWKQHRTLPALSCWSSGSVCRSDVRRHHCVPASMWLTGVQPTEEPLSSAHQSRCDHCFLFSSASDAKLLTKNK